MKSVVVWLAVAGVLWLAHSALDIRTPVEIYSSGGRVEFTVAGTTLIAPLAITSVSGIEFHVADAVYPPGGTFIEVASDQLTLVDETLPARFDLPRNPVVPLGDWELDDAAATGVVYSRPIDLQGSFVLRTALRGRFLHHATITLRGDPTTHFQLRRGMINNDLFIRDSANEVVAVTTIDPQPLRDIGAAAATLLRAATAAALLIACCVFAALFPIFRTIPEIPRWLVVTSVCFLVILATVRSLWIAGDILGGLPHQPDSIAYLQQAAWLGEGRVSAPQPAAFEHMQIPYTYFVDGRWVSHYPAGWPLLLSVGIAISRPEIIAPLLGGLFTLLLYGLGRELFNRKTALMATALATFSPMAGLMFGCYLSHAAASTAIVAFMFFLVRTLRTNSARTALSAGICIGCAFAVRPLTAVAVAVPCAVVLLFSAEKHPRHWRLVTAVIGGGVLATIPTLVHNAAVTGNALAFPYTLAKGTMFGAAVIPFGLRNMDTLLAHTVPAIFGWGWGLVSGWVFLALPLAFAVVPFLSRISLELSPRDRRGAVGRRPQQEAGETGETSRRKRRNDVLLAAVFAAVVIAHIGTRANGLHGFGPRYYFDVFCCLYLLTARGFGELARVGARRSFLVPALLFVILTGSTVARFGERFELYRGYNQVSGCLRDQLAEEAPDFGLILFASDDWRNWAEAAPMLSTDPDADLIFATLTGDNRVLADLYGDRPAWIWDGTTLRTLPED